MPPRGTFLVRVAGGTLDMKTFVRTFPRAKIAKDLHACGVNGSVGKMAASWVHTFAAEKGNKAALIVAVISPQLGGRQLHPSLRAIACCEIRDKSLYVSSLCTSSPGSGYGSEVLDEVERAARTLRKPYVEITNHVGVPQTAAFHLKRGYAANAAAVPNARPKYHKSIGYTYMS